VTSTARSSYRAWTLPLKSVVFGMCVFFFGSALAAFLTLYDVHGFLAFVDNLAAGIAAGLVVLFYERWRQREVDTKLRTIRLMNHHVRNALQVISAAPCGVDGSVQQTRVRDAVNRIEWALRDVLPAEIELTDAATPPKTVTPQKGSAA
jgi:hypothetical protein